MSEHLPARTLGTWALPAVCLVLAACGGGAGSPPGGRSPAPALASAAPPASLLWSPGSSFSASVDRRGTDQTATDAPGAPAVVTQVEVMSRQTLTVASVQDGVADLEVKITSWSWQHGNGSDQAGSLPAPAHLGVGSDGAIVFGTYWSMPLDLPLPGVDFFSSGLAPPGSPASGPWSASWQRTLPDNTILQCQARGGRLSGDDQGAPVMQTSVECPAVTRRTFAADGSPDVLQGDMKAVVRSSFDPTRRRVLGTTYNSSFADRESVPGGATTSTGTVTATISFSY